MAARVQQCFFENVRVLSVECDTGGLILPRMFSEHLMIGAVGASVWKTEVDGCVHIETAAHLLTRNAGTVFQVRSQRVHAHGGWFRAIFIPKETLNSIDEILHGPPFSWNFRLLAQEDVQLRAKLLDVHDTLTRGYCELEKSSRLLDLMANLKRHLSPTSAAADPRAPARVSRIKEYLRENFGRKITLAELAELSQCNGSLLIRDFKRHVGLAPYEYLQCYRVVAAKRMLSIGMPLAAIADACGFFDQSHLNRIFKRFSAGVSPGRYQSKAVRAVNIIQDRTVAEGDTPTKQ